ncbi:MAG: cupin domain-containing protein [Haloferacaceae archaeon]
MERIPYEAGESVEAMEGVHLAQLAAGDRMSVQHFFVEPGDVVPEHSHEHEQVGFVLEGSGYFIVDGEETFVAEGDSYVLPGGEPHALENRGDVPMTGIDVFSPPRENPDWAEE